MSPLRIAGCNIGSLSSRASDLLPDLRPYADKQTRLLTLSPHKPLDHGVASRETCKDNQSLCSLLWVLRKIWNGISFVGISRCRIPRACLNRAWRLSPAWQGAGQATPGPAKSWVQSVCHSVSARCQARFNRNKNKGINNHITKSPALESDVPFSLVYLPNGR